MELPRWEKSARFQLSSAQRTGVQSAHIPNCSNCNNQVGQVDGVPPGMCATRGSSKYLYYSPLLM
eukprot:1158446-Pelagomonas_calceolata.AAC.3